jgi:hypothetical protein
MLCNCRSIAIDDDRPTVMVSVSVVVTVLSNNDRFVAIPAVAIPKVFTIAIPITVAMDFTDGHTIAADTDTDFFRSGGNCAANTYHGGQCDCVPDHCVLL